MYVYNICIVFMHFCTNCGFLLFVFYVYSSVFVAMCSPESVSKQACPNNPCAWITFQLSRYSGIAMRCAGAAATRKHHESYGVIPRMWSARSICHFNIGLVDIGQWCQLLTSIIEQFSTVHSYIFPIIWMGLPRPCHNERWKQFTNALFNTKKIRKSFQY